MSRKDASPRSQALSRNSYRAHQPGAKPRRRAPFTRSTGNISALCCQIRHLFFRIAEAKQDRTRMLAQIRGRPIVSPACVIDEDRTCLNGHPGATRAGDALEKAEMAYLWIVH